MRRLRFGSILAAVAVATAGSISLMAAPAGAAVTCPSSTQFPNLPGAASELTVNCLTGAGDDVSSLTIHDAPNVDWHRGSGRQVTVDFTAASTTIAYTAGMITALDVHKPIAFATGGLSYLKGGTFIKDIIDGTHAHLSVAAIGGLAGALAKLDYTAARLLRDATCPAGGATVTLTSASATFDANDLFDSVVGGPFSDGAVISTILTASTVTVTNNGGANAACGSSPGPSDVIVIGGEKYSDATGATIVDRGEPKAIEVANNLVASGGDAGFTCVGSTVTLLAAAGTLDGDYTGESVKIYGTTTVGRTVSSNTATTITLSAACPAGIVASDCTTTVATCAGEIGIGGTGLFAPPGLAATGATAAEVMHLRAELNLEPALVSTSDDCGLVTNEGFEVTGTWNNPRQYVLATNSPVRSDDQISFPTSVVSFNGYIISKDAGDAAIGSGHTDFVFVGLPTSTALCSPHTATALAFSFDPTPLSRLPYVLYPTGSGNASDPQVRGLNSKTGTFTPKITVVNLGVPATITLTSCVVAARTTTPAFTCGS